MPAGNGAPRDFDAIYRGYARLVARWAARLGGPEVSVDDVVQDVFLVVSRRLADFRGDAKLTTWLFRITEKTVRNVRRQRRRRHWFARLTRRIEEAASTSQPTPVEAPGAPRGGRRSSIASSRRCPRSTGTSSCCTSWRRWAPRRSPLCWA